MNVLQTIEEHITIRNTIGYSILNKVDVVDIPNVLMFLKIIDNYCKMDRINNGGSEEG